MKSLLRKYVTCAWRRSSMTGIPSSTISLPCRCTSKINVSIDPKVLSQLEQDEFKPRHHPGIINLKRTELPAKISSALVKILGDHSLKTILKEGHKLNNYLKSRHPPPEKDKTERILTKIVEEIDQTIPLETATSNLTPEQLDSLQIQRFNLMRKRFNERTYAWRPIEYTEFMSRVYAVTRGAREYAILCRILKEILVRDPQFKPRSYFDFGSGVGTGMWAASNFWEDSIFEYFNVDTSREMNDLSDLILRNGNENEQVSLKNVFYRQFLPHLETKYDLIVCSHSLFELPNLKTRQEVILNLWNKCDGYLIVVEEGSRSGFELVHEARRLILNQKDKKCTVFAPCPHEMPCPRFTNTKERLPCSFETTFMEPKMNSLHKSKCSSALFSFVILRKTKNLVSEDNQVIVNNATLSENNSFKDDSLKIIEDNALESQSWPRLVQPTLLRPRHTICRMCTSEGKLQEIIFTNSKHGKTVHRCAKSSRWGDRLPIKL